MAKAENILKSVEKKVEVKVEKVFIPSEFFKDRKGLYVWNSFINNIVEKAKETASGAKFLISSFDLTKDANDEKIEKNLSKKHIFSETDVCAVVADLIEKQSKGEEGILINTGYANLFYTPSHVVHVYWDDGKWYVYDWYRVCHAWYAGERVFSPATDA